jgi:CRP-like cAMP-binding protein
MCRLCMDEWKPVISTYKKNFSYDKEELIFEEGDSVKGIFFVLKGCVKIHKKWGDEKEIIIRFAKEGGIFGHRGLSDDAIYPISATAIEPTTACYIDREFLMTTLKINHDFMEEMMKFLIQELTISERNMRNLAHMPVKGRLAQSLLTLTEVFGINREGFINVTLSKQDLASFVGTTYETLFRMLNELVEPGIIKVSNKNLAILDKEKLVLLTRDSVS